MGLWDATMHDLFGESYTDGVFFQYLPPPLTYSSFPELVIRHMKKHHIIRTGLK